MFAIAVADAGNIEEGVLAPTRDRFPVGPAFGRVDTDDAGPGDAAVTPFGMTLRVLPSVLVPVNPARIGYDHDAQVSVRLSDADGDIAMVSTMMTEEQTDGSDHHDSNPDSIDVD